MNKLILLVEDNEKILYNNKQMLEWEDFDTATALTLHEARLSIGERIPDAIVLDIILPDGNGLDFINELRAGDETSGIPVLLLTGLITMEDVVRGLTAGGDDYLTKPYNFDELLARIRAVIRRAERVPEIISKGKLSLDVTANIAIYDGKDLLLAQKEFALLLILMQSEGKFLSSGYLYEKIWNAPYINDNGAFKNMMSKLRKKLTDTNYIILFKRNEGYILKQI